jgi:hypothetical protein
LPLPEPEPDPEPEPEPDPMDASGELELSLRHATNAAADMASTTTSGVFMAREPTANAVAESIKNGLSSATLIRIP